MIIHILLLTALVWVTSKCEPPVNAYLPPGGGSSGGRPSPVYGPPGAGSGRSDSQGFGSPGAGRNQQSQDSYFPPGQTAVSNIPDTQYGPPDQNFNQGSQRRAQSASLSQGSFGQGNNNALSPNSQYGTPGQSNRPNQRQPNVQTPLGSGGPQSSYGPPNRDQGFGTSRLGKDGPQEKDSRLGQRPNSSYGPPPTGAIQSPNSFISGSLRFQDMQGSSYPTTDSSGSEGSPGARLTSGRVPSSSYGAPEFGVSPGGRGFGTGSNFGEEESEEPAKYEFSYDVDDAQTGTNFHHSEQRDGDIATGEYNVVLPDGRKQVVEYEAGLQGYKPQIRYEGGRSGSGRSGSGFGSVGHKGNRGSQSGNLGYPQNAPGGLDDGFQGQNNAIGYPQGGQNQEDRSVRFQQTEMLRQGEQQLGGDQYSMGYPRGRPSTDSNRQGLRGFSGKFDQESNNQFDSSRSNGIESLNGDSQGYASGRPSEGQGENDGSFPGGQGSNRGYQDGKPQTGGTQDGFQGGPQGGYQGRSQGSQRGSQGSRGSSGGDNGYPRGEPSGRRGSGF